MRGFIFQIATSVDPTPSRAEKMELPLQLENELSTTM
jgi:hypothetical protein